MPLLPATSASTLTSETPVRNIGILAGSREGGYRDGRHAKRPLHFPIILPLFQSKLGFRAILAS